ncbi:hypothetical protein M378DRAFT_173431 [Amanita muscaria Koide BX008]|uniref:Uncharacterized protein n=1 Tax=Amanita muscaria (strain Koide BX008) TaxID=946122 RepID=A0A0C2WHS2_AMAMK|nr:hypothetical protein M378DRAFT_173431 [Amanita muscaria Koide BX008]
MNTHQRKPYTGTETSLVIGIDVGTTLSGVSYAVLEPGKVPEIRPVVRYVLLVNFLIMMVIITNHTNARFSGQREEKPESKVPSVVCYDQDGHVLAAGSETDDEMNPILYEAEGKFTDSQFGDDDAVEAMVRAFDAPEGAKRMFRNPYTPYFVKFGGLRDSDRKYGITNGKFKVEGQQVAKFFEPAVQDIIAGIINQCRNTKDGVSIKHVLLIGGFGRSEYLYTRLRDYFKSSGIIVLRPDNAHLDKAAADGSVSWYLDWYVHGDGPDDGSSATRRFLESMTKLLIRHADRLTKQPDFHGIDHFVPEFGNLTNRKPLTIEDWEQTLDPLLNVLNKLLVSSKIGSLKDQYCQQCRFFQITSDILTHFRSLRQREDPDVEKYLKSLEEIIRYGDAGNFDMNFNRVVFGSAAIVGFIMAIVAHQR